MSTHPGDRPSTQDPSRTPPTLECLRWADARQLLKACPAAPALRPLIDAAEHAAKQSKGKDRVYIARYSFGSEVISGGQLKLPSTLATDQLPVPIGATPLCVVLSKSFEVCLTTEPDWTSLDRKSVDRTNSLRLLNVGSLFGVFEIADRICGITDRLEPWSVFAGSRTARIVYPLKNQHVKNLIREKLKWAGRNISCILDDGDPEEWTWHLAEAWARRVNDRWSAEILIFPEAWSTSDHALMFQLEAFKASWQQVHADNSRALRSEEFRERAEDQKDPLHSCQKSLGADGDFATQLLTCLDEVTAGRSVAWIPSTKCTSAQFEQSGPYQRMLDDMMPLIRKKRRNEDTLPIVMLPTYLEPGQTGYVSLSRPSLLTAQTKTSRRLNAFVHLGDLFGKPDDEVDDVLQSMLPDLDISSLRFYGSFQGPDERCRKLEELAKAIGGSGVRLHTSGSFFTQSARVTRLR